MPTRSTLEQLRRYSHSALAVQRFNVSNLAKICRIIPKVALKKIKAVSQRDKRNDPSSYSRTFCAFVLYLTKKFFPFQFYSIKLSTKKIHNDVIFLLTFNTIWIIM